MQLRFQEYCANFGQSELEPSKYEVVRELVRRLIENSDNVQLIPLRGDYLTHKFKGNAKQAALTPDLTFHSLMHTFATKPAQEGVTPRNLLDLLGDEDSRGTVIYTHSVSEEFKWEVGKARLPKL